MGYQFLLMVGVTLAGIVGGLGFGPFVALLVYYLNAVLRPQSLWHYYPSVKETGWSLPVAVIAIISAALYRLGIIGYSACGPTRGAKHARWNAIHWCFLGFAAWITLRYALTAMYGEPVDVKRSDQIFTEYYKLFVMWLVSSFVIHRLSQLWILVAVVALSDAFVAFEANMTYFRFRYNTIQRNGFGGLDNNGAGLMLAMGIPLCYFLWEGTKSKFRWVFLACLPWLVHGVMLTFSRGAMVSVLACVPVVFLFSRYKGWLALLMALAGAGVIATAGPELQERFFSIKQHDLDASANERKTTWKIAYNLANENPFFGLGLRCSQRHVSKYGAAENQAIHSQYLQIAVDAGWVGLLWFSILVAAVLWVCSKLWWRMRKWPPYPEVLMARALAGALSSSILVYCFGAIFLSLDNFEMPYILFMVVAQLWMVYSGGGIEASVTANGSYRDPAIATEVAKFEQRRLGHRRFARQPGRPVPAPMPQRRTYPAPVPASTP